MTQYTLRKITTAVCATLLLIGVAFLYSSCAAFSHKPTVNLSEPNYTTDTPAQIGQKILVKMNWIGTASVLVIILGGTAIFFGHSVGIKVLGAGFIGLVTYFTVLRFSNWIPLIGLVGVVSLTAYMLLIRSKGWKETIGSVNALLDIFPKEVITKTGAVVGPDWTEEKLRARMVAILKESQPSETTHLLVRQIKNSLQVQGEKAEGFFTRFYKRIVNA